MTTTTRCLERLLADIADIARQLDSAAVERGALLNRRAGLFTAGRALTPPVRLVDLADAAQVTTTVVHRALKRSAPPDATAADMPGDSGSPLDDLRRIAWRLAILDEESSDLRSRRGDLFADGRRQIPPVRLVDLAAAAGLKHPAVAMALARRETSAC